MRLFKKLPFLVTELTEGKSEWVYAADWCKRCLHRCRGDRRRRRVAVPPPPSLTPTHHVSQKWHYLVLANRSYIVRGEEKGELDPFASSHSPLEPIAQLNDSYHPNRRIYALKKWWVLGRCVGFKTYCALLNFACTMTSYTKTKVIKYNLWIKYR